MSLHAVALPFVGDKPCMFSIIPDVAPQAMTADMFAGKKPVTLNTVAINITTTQVM